jgi:hypothetical protein
VVVAYVYDGHQVAYAWHHSVMELLSHEMNPANQPHVLLGGWIAMKCGTDGLAEARNNAVRAFLDEDRADWLFWIDTDMGFPADIIDRLAEVADPQERPIVGALAFTWREEGPDGMGGWRTAPVPTIFDWKVLSDDHMGFSVRYDIPADTVTTCAGTGSACVLIHKSVFERVREKYGDHWYDRVPNPTMGKLTSEDLSLCLRAGSLQIPVHVHTGVKTTHQKTLWVSETDYTAALVLDKLAAGTVPPAEEACAVLVPVLWRPGKAAPFMEAFNASGAPLATVYAIADPEDEETAAAWREAGATVLYAPDEIYPGTFPQKVNAGYAQTSEPWLCLTGDDCAFHPGWLDHALYAARNGASVVGTNDLHNPRVTAGQHATNWLIRRSYVDEQGGGWDGPKVLAHEGYRHLYVDDETVQAAKQRGAWVWAQRSVIEHLNVVWGLSDADKTHERGLAHADEDRALYRARLAASIAEAGR